MLGLIIAMLLAVGLVSLLTSYSLLGGAIQIVLICALVVLGIQRMRAVHNRIREYRLN
jgi:hypothetical protein